MDAHAANRPIEITAFAPHVGWKGGKPVFAAFSMAQAKSIFEDFERGSTVICIAPPHAAVAADFEQAVAFFSDDDRTNIFVIAI